jgi:glucose/arabinose dehydrogenase
MIGRAAILAGLVLAGLAAAVPAAAQEYVTSGTCDGFARVKLSTPAGLCVGLVARGIGFPRGVATIGSDVYVADLGARRPGRGRVLRFSRGGHGPVEVVLAGLDQPNGIAPAPGGGLYVGVVGGIIRFDPRARDPQGTVRPILTGLPSDGLHMLTAFAVAPDGALLVNVGSASDNCGTGRSADRRKPCGELARVPPRGAILRVRPLSNAAVDARKAQVVAIGLRNSMAMAFTPQGALLAAGNARDHINKANPKLSDAELPHEPLVRVVHGADYGWPYCFDNLRASPEYPRFDCRRKRAPERLLPPHAAPLGAAVARGGILGPGDRLLLAFHGYRPAGHRIVALRLDGAGRTVGDLVDVVAGWEPNADHPRGAPVGIAIASDGSIFIAEDRNGTLLRVSRVRGR